VHGRERGEPRGHEDRGGAEEAVPEGQSRPGTLAARREPSEGASDRDLGAVGDPQPARNGCPALKRARCLELDAIEGGLDHRVVPADQDRHQRSPPRRDLRIEEMGDAGLVRPKRLQFEAVSSRQLAARREPEDDAPAGLVFDHRVAD
jgi:hypothetical protein